MSDVAIRITDLSKRFRLGRREPYLKITDIPGRTLALWAHGLGQAVSRLLGREQPAAAPAALEDYWALRDVSFEVHRGEVLGIIGRNGAGKSTLLKILSRITRPTLGEVQLRGRVGSLLEVGTGFHPELTGRENIYLNGTILGMRKAEIDRKFDRIVAFSEIERFLDTPVKLYSSGMYMRLAFSVAAHLESEILLVDEVLAVGDAQFQKKCLGKMGEVARGGRTVLFVSHNMGAVQSLCRSAVVLANGSVCMKDNVESAVRQYLLTTCDESAVELDTTDLIRPGDVRDRSDLRITRLRLLSGPLHFTGKPLELEIEFSVERPLSEVVMGWAVHLPDGTRLFECRSIEDGAPWPYLAPGRYRLQTAVRNNPLNPGLYTLHIGARCAQGGLDYLPEVLTLTVESECVCGDYWLEGSSGVVRVSSTWTRPESSWHTNAGCQSEVEP